VKICLDAAEILLSNGHNPTVVNLRWVRPLDRKLLKDLAAEHQFIVVVEDHTICGGVGSAILETLSDIEKTVCVRIIVLPDRFVEHGSRAELLFDCGITKEHVAQVCNKLLR
ncbi:MAG: 1-deoxy-D-xylulose-5-phosphate synthase, partial [Planctomycetota bacterium]